jgi:hypothetical protein
MISTKNKGTYRQSVFDAGIESLTTKRLAEYLAVIGEGCTANSLIFVWRNRQDRHIWGPVLLAS